METATVVCIALVALTIGTVIGCALCLYAKYDRIWQMKEENAMLLERIDNLERERRWIRKNMSNDKPKNPSQ